MNDVEERIIKVNEFVGPSYTNGLFGFRYNQELVPFSIGDHHGSPYHLDMGLIEALSSDFPEYITMFNPKREKVSEWGPQTEIGLCKLMLDEKMKWIRKNNDGEEILVHFIWDGLIWQPKNRPTKRK